MKFDADLDGVCQELELAQSAFEKVARKLPRSLGNKSYIAEVSKSLNKAHMNAFSAIRLAQIERYAQSERDQA